MTITQAQYLDMVAKIVSGQLSNPANSHMTLSLYDVQQVIYNTIQATQQALQQAMVTITQETEEIS